MIWAILIATSIVALIAAVFYRIGRETARLEYNRELDRYEALLERAGMIPRAPRDMSADVASWTGEEPSLKRAPPGSVPRWDELP